MRTSFISSENGGSPIAAEANENTESGQFSLDWLVSNLRWLWLFLAAIFVLAENRLSGGSSRDLVTLLGLIFVGALFNGIYAGLLWSKILLNWLAVFGTLIDLVLAIALFILLHEHAQLLLPIMLFPVLMAGLRWNTEAGLLVALPIVLSYSMPLVLIVLSDNVNRAELIRTLVDVGVNALVLFFVGALPGFFIGQHIKYAERENEAEIQRLRVENERGRLISEMAVTLSSTLDYRRVLRAMIDLAFSAMAEVGTRDESAVGMVLLFEGPDGKLTVAAGRNIGRTDQGRYVNSEEGLIGRVIQTAEVLITHNVQKDKTLTSFSSSPNCRSAICAPLRAGFDTYGVVLFLSTEPGFYNEEHKKLLTTFCSQAIIALQNAQLVEDLRGEQQKILEKEAEARRKLARDLHDGPTQSIAAIAMRLNFVKMVVKNRELEKAFDEIIKIEEIAQRTTQEIRTMLFAMRPVILETQGLVPALEQYVERLNANESFRVRFINKGYDGQLSAVAEGVIFAIIEEAVGNAKKHAQATEIRISLLAKGDHLFAEVKDNGVGFDLATTQSTYDQRTSLGLINLEERAQLVGGDCTIESAPGRGTAVRIEVPFEAVLEEEV
jgi:signal transduction histidine kinase